ncbi:CAP domain-containing protein [Paracoccus tegillarcae]|uniref:SCP domain-containing protein n=1 Tax=Paracoccus tegillarcae TaxID=1529068 RepID=A0A2K9EU25_9RHOB|nr:CAP domain-containing protein [Paracoccus tegillarcae]AUH32724.1 hypothetical protein CUV01_04415 [Paracoccus tegillarcae]
MTYATQDERYLLDLINQSRAANGQDRLFLERHLNRSADNHSIWMLDADVFSHTGAGGSSSSQRLRDAGFDLSNGWATAENIAYVTINNNGTLTDEIEQLHRNLMNSSGHRANLLSDRYDLVGIGLQVGEMVLQGQTRSVLMLTENFASTGGHIEYDLAPGVSIHTINDPGWITVAPSRAEWAPFFNGQVMTGAATTEVTGSWGSDDFRMGGGADRLRGMPGDDWMAGGGGEDTILGSAGNDYILGQWGNDTLNGENGDDRLSGGSGNDYIVGGNGNDVMRGDDGHDRMLGQGGHDNMAGGNGNDIIRGHWGNDRLDGGAGNDQLFGGQMRDWLDGGPGDDRLWGEAGPDNFVFRGSDIGRDRVMDFQPGQDRLMIDDALIAEDLEEFVASSVRKINGGVLIDLADDNQITVIGADLTAAQVADSIFLF